jgi:phosphotransferase system HPr-like phosphotransfer protein
MLAAEKGAKIHVTAFGKDAEEAVEAILTLAKDSFNIKY